MQPKDFVNATIIVCFKNGTWKKFRVKNLAVYYDADNSDDGDWEIDSNDVDSAALDYIERNILESIEATLLITWDAAEMTGPTMELVEGTDA